MSCAAVLPLFLPWRDEVYIKVVHKWQGDDHKIAFVSLLVVMMLEVE